jgi:hypothetical protein
VQDLKLPRFASYSTAQSGKDMWDAETYDDFAQRMMHMNPSVAFTKETMDEAFEKAASSLSKKVSSGDAYEGMMKRVSVMVIEMKMRQGGDELIDLSCLGKESKAYWKQR